MRRTAAMNATDEVTSDGQEEVTNEGSKSERRTVGVVKRCRSTTAASNERTEHKTKTTKGRITKRNAKEQTKGARIVQGSREQTTEAKQKTPTRHRRRSGGDGARRTGGIGGPTPADRSAHLTGAPLGAPDSHPKTIRHSAPLHRPARPSDPRPPTKATRNHTTQRAAALALGPRPPTKAPRNHTTQRAAPPASFLDHHRRHLERVPGARKEPSHSGEAR